VRVEDHVREGWRLTDGVLPVLPALIPQGMTSTWPTLMSLVSEMPFAFAIALTVTPNRAAMPLSVSPDWTV
jgi:hypothetical protein